MTISTSIQDFLKKHFNLGRDSEIFQRLSPQCLTPPFYQNPAGKLRPNPDYEPPTPYHIATFKEMTSLSTGDLARRTGIEAPNMSKLVGQRFYEQNKKLHSSIWRPLIEAAGLAPRSILKPRFCEIREEVLETSQILPTQHELFLICGLSGLRYETIAALAGLEPAKIIENARRGQDSNSNRNTHANLDVVLEMSTMKTSDVSLSLAEWAKIREVLHISGVGYMKSPPLIRAATISTEREIYSPYKKNRKKVATKQPIENDLLDIREFYPSLLEQANLKSSDNGLVTINFTNKLEPYYELSIEQYSPPTPLELMQIIRWTGFYLSELAELMGLPENQLAFLISPSAEDHKYKTQLSNPDVKARTKHIKYVQWRRLLEAFNLVHQKQIRRTYES